MGRITRGESEKVRWARLQGGGKRTIRTKELHGRRSDTSQRMSRGEN